MTNKVEGDDLEWDGDDGLLADWNMYYRYPTDSYLAQPETQSKHVIEL